MSNEKSTDPGLSAAERKELRSREAKEAIADHEEGQRAVQVNLERLRVERLAREAATGPMLYPVPNLPDDTLIEMVRFPPLIRKSLNAAGLKTIGEIRAMSDDKLRRMRGVGTGSLAHLRKTIGTGLKAKIK